MNFKLAVGAAISSAFIASAATAASLSIVGGTTETLSGSGSNKHNPDYTALVSGAPTVGAGDDILAFGGSSFEAFDGSNGLMLNNDAPVRITFLGKEAGAKNAAMNFAGGSLSNTGAAGASIQSFDLASWVDLTFETFKTNNPAVSLGSITNNTGGAPSGTSVPLSMGFYLEDSKNALAFFGDGRGDSDFDDMVVRISVIPLPAGGLLLLTALGGLAAVRRKKKAA